ncbi:YolD-like family protein [Sporosarcina globispora]|uniref:YolD-like family protein n=1 Tax=Sporosarcina globispora TaxID=1459 RepID=UPI0009E6786C|nr:YolD-like family protein [Sporosarcina globispora]
MIRDRGKMKWQSAFFMPEHVKMLKQITFDDKKQKKPLLDEQEFEEIGFIVMDSLNYTIPIKVTIWQEGFFETITGIVAKVDMLMKYILFECDDGRRRISIGEITGVERV